MARGVTISTVFLNERGGYQITDIDSSVYSYGFKQALRGIRAERASCAEEFRKAWESAPWNELNC